MYELVNSVPMPVREYSGQRVVTFRDIDTLHHRPEGTAKRNFNKNRKYFIEGIDFFTINQPYEIRTVGFERQQGGTHIAFSCRFCKLLFTGSLIPLFSSRLIRLSSSFCLWSRSE